MEITEQKLRDYLKKREVEIQERINSEVLSGNSVKVKELCERFAMVEIVAIWEAFDL